MRTHIEKYRKQILAIFGIILMIAFIVPSTMKQPGDRANRVIGYAGKTAIRITDLQLAERDWSMLTHSIEFRNPANPREFRSIAEQSLPGPLIEAITAHKELFILLTREAQERGVLVTGQQVQAVVDSEGLSITRGDNIRVSYSDLNDRDQQDLVAHAIAQLLLIVGSEERNFELIKISQPLVRQVMSEDSDSADLTLVEVNAADYASTIPSPTPEQLQEQFKKYAAINPDNVDQSPYGFGYQFPDRLKLQYVEVPMSEVRAAAERKRNKDVASQYDWDKDAFRYFQSHPREFAATQPSATTAPATQPFATSKAQARQLVLEDDIARLAQRVEEKIQAAMNSDFAAFKNAATMGAKIPASSVGPAYNTFEYLQQLSRETLKNFDVALKIDAQEKEFLSRDQLNSAVPDLTTTGIMLQNNRPVSVIDYLFARGQAFVPASVDESRALNLFEPAPVAREFLHQNTFFIRITAMEKTHAPQALAEVQAKVDQDVRMALALAKARTVADPIATQARQTGSLAQTAEAMKRKPIIATGVRFAGLLPDGPLMTPDELHLTIPASQRAFLRQAFALAGNARGSTTQPVGLIELPRIGRLFVTQVNQVHAGASALTDLGTLNEMRKAQQERRVEFARLLLADWFDAENIKTRMNYTSSDAPAKPAPAGGNAPAANQPLM